VGSKVGLLAERDQPGGVGGAAMPFLSGIAAPARRTATRCTKR